MFLGLQKASEEAAQCGLGTLWLPLTQAQGSAPVGKHLWAQVPGPCRVISGAFGASLTSPPMTRGSEALEEGCGTPPCR